LAKLRSHNDLTLDILDSVTTSLGKELRRFRDHTCSAYATRELEREYHARLRREAKSGGMKQSGNAGNIRIVANPVPSDVVTNSSQSNTHPSSAQNSGNTVAETPNRLGIGVANPTPPVTAANSVEPNAITNRSQLNITEVNAQNPSPIPVPNRPSIGRRPKTFNLNTYKFHSVGDYVSTIRKYGTTDSYTTEIVSKPLVAANATVLICVICLDSAGRIGASFTQILVLAHQP
jgi:hypothetical protein